MATFHVIPKYAVPPDPRRKRAARITPERLLASLLLLAADDAPAPTPSEIQENLRKRRAEENAAEPAQP